MMANVNKKRNKQQTMIQTTTIKHESDSQQVISK